MDVRCERCRTEYELEDSSVSDEGVQVQCMACGHLFQVSKPAKVPTVASGDSPQPAEWLLETADGSAHRFRNLTSLQKWIIERKVTRDDRISRTGHAWKRLGEIVELAAFFEVVDEADRGRAAALEARADSGHNLRLEAETARRNSPARGVPAMALATASPSSSSPASSSSEAASQVQRVSEDLGLSDVSDLPSPEDTAVVRLKSGSATKLLLVLAVAGVVAVFGIKQIWKAPVHLPGFGSSARAPAPTRSTPSRPSVVPMESPPATPAPAAAAPAPTAASPAPATASPAPAAATPAPAAATPTPSAPEPAPAAASATAAAKAPVPPAGGSVAAPTRAGMPAPAQATEVPAVSYDKLIADADRLLENGVTERARSLYERALKMNPSGAAALSGLGYVLLDKGRTAQASALFRKALAQNATLGSAIFGLAEAHRASGQDQAALDEYRRYLAIDPTGTDVPAARQQIKTLEARLSAPAPAAETTEAPAAPPQP